MTMQEAYVAPAFAKNYAACMQSALNDETSGEKLTLGPLDQDDVQELHRAFSEVGLKDYRIVSEPAGGFRAGDAGVLILIVALAPAVIPALAAFILKRRARSHVKYSLTIQYADGTELREELDVSTSDSESPDAEIVAQLSRLGRLVPPAELPPPQ